MALTINKQYISQKNINGVGNSCKYIIIHETDNTSKGAGAKTHASAQYNGHFTDMSVHYYCGSDGIYQAAEHTCKCWHIGREYGGNHSVKDANNNNSIGIEICVNSDGDYTKARANAIALVQYLIKTTGISASRIIRHYDAKGKYCPRKMLDKPSLWTDFKTQIGNAAVKTAGTQASAFKGLSEKQAAEKCLALCREDAKTSGIFAAVSAAQMILESGYVTTDLAIKANNCFGMKCILSGNTWAGTTWDGSSKLTKSTKEQKSSGEEYTVIADFRKYPCIEKSVADHSAYLLGAMNGSALRYKGLTAAKDYKDQIAIIKQGGYATDTKYVDKICSLIGRYNLNRYDNEKRNGAQADASAENKNVMAAQIALNRSFGTTLTIDGIWGEESQKAWVRALQMTLNKEYRAGLVVDGISGTMTKTAIRTVRYGDNNLLVGVLQIALYSRNYVTGGIDCSFGPMTREAVNAFQCAKGLKVDGIVGRLTWGALFN